MGEKCQQCGKPALLSYDNGKVNLCLECSEKLEAMVHRKNEMYSQQLRELQDSLSFITGVPIPRTPAAMPQIFTAPITNNKISINNSVVGSVNTGTIHSLNVSLSQIHTSNPEVASLLKQFIEAVAKEAQFSATVKQELLERLSFIAGQVTLPKQEQKHSLMAPILKSIGETVTHINSLMELWGRVEVLIRPMFS